MSRAIAATLSAALLLATPVLVPTAVAAPAPECGGSALDWAGPDEAGTSYLGPAGLRVDLLLDKHRLQTDETHGTGQWEIRRYYGDGAPSVLHRSQWGDTVLGDPQCEDPAHATRVTRTTATVEGVAAPLVRAPSTVGRAAQAAGAAAPR